MLIVNLARLLYRSEAMYSVLKQVEMVAQSDSTVLILGETGTGKRADCPCDP